MSKEKFISTEFLKSAYDLRIHLTEFLPIKLSDLDLFLNNAKQELANLHPGDNSIECSEFYENIVGDKHLAELAAWHINSKEYISNTLKLQENFS